MSNSVIKFHFCEDDDNSAAIIFDKVNNILSCNLDNVDNRRGNISDLTTEFILSKNIDNIKNAVNNLLENKYIQDPKCDKQYSIEYIFEDSNLTLRFEVEWENCGCLGMFLPIIKNEYFSVVAIPVSCSINPIKDFRKFLENIMETF